MKKLVANWNTVKCRSDWPEPSSESLPEEEKLLNVIDALKRIEHTTWERQETAAHQLKAVQMQFIIEVEQAKDTQDLNSNSDNGPVQHSEICLPSHGGGRRTGCCMLAQW